MSDPSVTLQNTQTGAFALECSDCRKRELIMPPINLATLSQRYAAFLVAHRSCAPGQA